MCALDDTRYGHKDVLWKGATDTVWPGVHQIINYGIFAKLGSKNPKGKVPKGVLPLRLKYWLPNYDHTQHIIFPAVNSYTPEELVVVPSETAQIQRYQASRRMAPPTSNESPAYSIVARREEDVASRSEQDASDTYPPSLTTTTLVTKQSDIKTFLTPTKPPAKPPKEIIEINTNDSNVVTQQRPTEEVIQTTTTISPTHLPELERESSVTGKTEADAPATVDRVDDTQPPTVQPPTILPTTESVATATTDTIVEHNVTDNRIVQAAVEASVDVTPQILMPQQTIDQILVDTPAPTEREAAEALGELANTTVEESKTEKNQKKRRLTTTTSSPATPKPKKRQTHRRY
jgi:hypothetical protein